MLAITGKFCFTLLLPVTIFAEEFIKFGDKACEYMAGEEVFKDDNGIGELNPLGSVRYPVIPVISEIAVLVKTTARIA
jgi:hypothetical protein